MDMQAVIAVVIAIVVMFFVPYLVWHTVITGLIHIIREKAQESLDTAIMYSERYV